MLAAQGVDGRRRDARLSLSSNNASGKMTSEYRVTLCTSSAGHSWHSSIIINSSPQPLIRHGYRFDPTHGYGLDELLKVEAPEEPPDYAKFWRTRYAKARALPAHSTLTDTGTVRNGWRVFDWEYTSTDEVTIRGWALLPERGIARRGFIIGHGYGGRDGPDFDLPLEDSALFFPCARGIGRSAMPSISSEPYWHVLHDIQDRDRYVLGGCVEDVWLAITAMLEHLPELAGHVGYLGISFGGGIGVMAAAWEERLQRLHVNVPSFGHQPLRRQLATVGSGAAVQIYLRRKPESLEVLRYFDAALAARHTHIPVHCACALFDPAVAPAGQFAIYNALAGPKQLFVLSAGHHDHPGMLAEEAAMKQEIHAFFKEL